MSDVHEVSSSVAAEPVKEAPIGRVPALETWLAGLEKRLGDLETMPSAFETKLAALEQHVSDLAGVPVATDHTDAIETLRQAIKALEANVKTITG